MSKASAANLADITPSTSPTAFSKYSNCDTALERTPKSERNPAMAKMLEE